MSKWKTVGHIGVDAGLCWLGDPCYILHAKDLPTSLGKNWQDFCDRLGKEYPTTKSFSYDLGHEGLGVAVSTGFGDGVYPVKVELTKEGRVGRVMVEFISDNEDGNDED